MIKRKLKSKVLSQLLYRISMMLCVIAIPMMVLVFWLVQREFCDNKMR